MYIAMTGCAGLAASLRLAAERRTELTRRLDADFLAHFLQSSDGSEEAVPEGYLLRDPVGEGGVYAALWRLADRAETVTGEPHLGLHVILRKIPIRQETIEICEILNEDPYQLPGGGWLYLLKDGGGGEKVIGRMQPGKARIVTGYAGDRYLTPPARRGRDGRQGDS